MTWCDKLASTPSVGFKLDFHFSPPDELLAALAPILDRAVKNDKPTFTLNQYDPAGAVAFTIQEGFKYSADTIRAVVGFEHILRQKVVSAGPPIMEMLSNPLPFSKLLPSVAEKLVEATLLLCEKKPRRLFRIGIISTTRISDDELPPGLKRFVSYIGRPWKGKVESFNHHIVSKLGDEPGWSDRCINDLIKLDEEPDEPMRVQFDWQRSFQQGRAITREALHDLLEDAQKDALSHFEELAVGNQFDEALLSSTVDA